MTRIIISDGDYSNCIFGEVRIAVPRHRDSGGSPSKMHPSVLLSIGGNRPTLPKGASA